MNNLCLSDKFIEKGNIKDVFCEVMLFLRCSIQGSMRRNDVIYITFLQLDEKRKKPCSVYFMEYDKVRFVKGNRQIGQSIAKKNREGGVARRILGQI